MNTSLPTFFRFKGQRRGFFLARCQAFLRRFDAVVDRVPYKVHDRIGDVLDDVFVHFRILAKQFQPD
ncbi:hypothetical protein HMSSN036_32910 [Paenibacillus macerans]|nr:hypothetical protein HMSSN036_32910 [Paenibacillus macerans]